MSFSINPLTAWGQIKPKKELTISKHFISSANLTDSLLKELSTEKRTTRKQRRKSKTTAMD